MSGRRRARTPNRGKARELGEVIRQKFWTKNDIPTSKEDGAAFLYDEPDHAMTSDAATWPPRYVDLSSAWVYKVVRNEDIPHTTRYAMWPTTFGSKAGLQSAWKNKGRAAKVLNEDDGSWHYPIVFNSLQLHGEEGERALLSATGLVTGKPHNKHTIAIGAACVPKNEEEKQSFKAPSIPKPQAPGFPPAGIVGQVAENSSAYALGQAQLVGSVTEISSSNIQTRLPTIKPSLKQAPVLAHTPARVDSPVFDTPHVFEDERRRAAFRKKWNDDYMRRFGRLPPTPASSGKQSNTVPAHSAPARPPTPASSEKRSNTIDILADQPSSGNESLSVDTVPARTSLTKPAHTLDMSEDPPQKRRKKDMLARPEPDTLSFDTVSERQDSSTMKQEEDTSTPHRLPIIAQEIPVPSNTIQSDIGDVAEEEELLSDDSSTSSRRSFVPERFVNMASAYYRQKYELRTLRDDFEEVQEQSAEFEAKLGLADGKVMLMTKALHAAFRTLLELSKTIKKGSSLATTFIGLYAGWPEEGRKFLDPHKRECDSLLEAVRAANTTTGEMNKMFDKLEACFPRSKRITTADAKGIQDWCAENYSIGGKAVEDDDHVIDENGELVLEEDDENDEMVLEEDN